MAAAGGASSDVTEGPVLSTVFAEFLATLLFLYVTVATVIGHKKQTGPCDGFGILGIAWSFGGMIFVLVYCTAGIAWSFDGMSFGAAVIYNNPQVWVQHWIFWVGPFVGAMAAAAYHK